MRRTCKRNIWLSEHGHCHKQVRVPRIFGRPQMNKILVIPVGTVVAILTAVMAPDTKESVEFCALGLLSV